MSIRAKLTVLMLTLAVVPLVLIAWLEFASTRRFGRELSARVGDELRAIAAAQLERMVIDQSALLADASARIELAIRYQATQVERAFATPPRPGEALLTADDFDRGRVPPEELVEDDRYFQLGPDGGRIPRPISTTRHSIAFAPDAGDRAADDAARLTSLAGAFASVRTGVADLVTWQYATLASGVHAVYPGHGGYPPDFDARKRPWYEAAVASNGIQWNVPIIDAATGQLVITVSAPIRSAAGEPVGATGMDIRVVDIVRHVALPQNLAQDARVLLVANPPAWVEGGKLPILASRDYDRAAGNWDTPVELASLQGDGPGFARVLQDLGAGRAGVATIPGQGGPDLWAYAPSRTGRTNLVVIVPERVVTRAAEVAGEQVDAAFISKATQLAIVAVGAIALCVVAAIIAGGRVTGPVRRITSVAQRVAEGDLDARIGLARNDELGTLSAAIDDMIPKLEDRVRLVDSLQMAREVQQHLLPADAPLCEGLEVVARSVYCDETGGDYYDFLRLENPAVGGLTIAVGDVTGHGIAAALLMAGARAMMRVLSAGEHGADRVMGMLNNGLVSDTDAGRFMTMFYLQVEPRTHELHWSSAGHDPAITYDPESDTFAELAGADPPLGIESGWAFSVSHRAAIRPGEVILIGTDGIWEQRNESGEMFGKHRLREVVRAHARDDAGTIAQAVHDAVRAWRGTVAQGDDVTLAVIRARP